MGFVKDVMEWNVLVYGGVGYVESRDINRSVAKGPVEVLGPRLLLLNSSADEYRYSQDIKKRNGSIEYAKLG